MSFIVSSLNFIVSSLKSEFYSVLMHSNEFYIVFTQVSFIVSSLNFIVSSLKSEFYSVLTQVPLQLVTWTYFLVRWYFVFQIQRERAVLMEYISPR